MKRKLFLVFLLVLSLCMPLEVMANINDINAQATKTASISDDNKTATIVIESKVDEVVPNVLFAQGTMCDAHGFVIDAIPQGINSLLQYGNVDYFYDTQLSTSLERKTSGNIISFSKGSTFPSGYFDDSDEKKIVEGYHVITGNYAQTLKIALNKDYDLVVLVFDGTRGGKISRRYFDDTFFNEWLPNVVNVSKKLSKYQDGNSLIYLQPYGDKIYMQTGGSDGSDMSQPITPDIINNLDDRFIDYGYSLSYAFLDPKEWLSHIKSDGTYKDTFTKDDISVPKNMVAYNNASAVGNYLKDLMVVNKFLIRDKLVSGLSTTSKNVKAYVKNTSGKYEAIDSSKYTVNVTGRDVSVDFGKEYLGKQVKIEILADISREKGLDGKLFDTNDGEASVNCINVNSENGVETVIKKVELDPPQIKKEIKVVKYLSEKGGKVIGKLEERLNKYENTLIGTELKADDNTTFAGWKADKDVKLKDGKVIKKGELLKEEEMLNINVTEDLVLTAYWLTNPVTGSALIIIVSLLLLASIGVVYYLYKYKLKDKKISKF